jgi:hypothetical protein
LIFSKLKGGYWPNIELVAEKCQKIVEEEANGNDVTAYLAGNTITKDGAVKQSSVKKRSRRAVDGTPEKSFEASGFSNTQG